jgi:LacI family transcriptional regulator
LLPTELELCRRLRISRMTLRAALAQVERERLIRRGRGRRREVVARKRPARPAKTSVKVVLLTPEPLHRLTCFEMYWVDELRSHLADAGYQLEVQEQSGCHGPNGEHTLHALDGRLRPAGWVLHKSTARMQRWFSKRGARAVITGSRHSDVALPSVDLDNRAVCRHAVGRLRARGHLRLALVVPASGLAGELASERGFLEGAGGESVRSGEAVIGRHADTRASVCGCLNELLRRRSPPTGFLVANANSALTAHCFLLEKGLKLPQEVALISRDHDRFLEEVVPSLARYSCDPTLLARKISGKVLAVVRGAVGQARADLVMPDFVPGESLG